MAEFVPETNVMAKGEHAASAHKVVSVLGATGSVGDSSLDVIAKNPSLYSVGALTAHSNVEKLALLARETGAKFVAVGREELYGDLKERLSDTDIEVAAGESGLQEAAAYKVDLVVGAIVGAAGIRPTMAALRAGNGLALANKEALVCAGDLVMAEARKQGQVILPVDSEHNAIFQIFENENIDQIEEVTITASGGPFRVWCAEDIAVATPEQALKHPNWSMGAKISIDSASMMNKGLEVIEAYHLYDVGLDKFSVVVHPQSVIHGMVSYKDGSVLAHLGAADMRIPVAHCLAWPNRIQADTRRLSLIEVGQLTFEAPDPVRFPCLGFALEAIRAGGNVANIMNAANEIAVESFLERKILFGGIARVIEQTMERLADLGQGPAASSIDEVLAIDARARVVAREVVASVA